MATKIKDLTNNRYSNLVVKERLSIENRITKYKCLCDCGKEFIARHGNLQSNKVKSCGCITNIKIGKDSHTYKHGFSKNHKTYKSWCKIKERCYNKNNKDYYNYGALGIYLHNTFMDFINFYNEIGEPPNKTEKWSVDRKDNNLSYIPGNIKWSNSYEQARNKSKMSNNTSGFTGVQWECYKGWTTVKATWYDLYSGKQQHKRFSVKKLGLLEAFNKAVHFRQMKIRELNQLGGGYAGSHGLIKNVKGV